MDLDERVELSALSARLAAGVVVKAQEDARRLVAARFVDEDMV